VHPRHCKPGKYYHRHISLRGFSLNAISQAPNGENDGGLMVLEGSFPLYNEFIDAHEDDKPEGGWPKIDSYHHTEKQLQWFYDRGCTWKKSEDLGSFSHGSIADISLRQSALLLDP
jgi:hypothetical protein